jgi:hypothetical protein
VQALYGGTGLARRLSGTWSGSMREKPASKNSPHMIFGEPAPGSAIRPVAN